MKRLEWVVLGEESDLLLLWEEVGSKAWANLNVSVGARWSGRHAGLGVPFNGDVSTVTEHDSLGLEFLCKGHVRGVRFCSVDAMSV